MAMSKVNSQVSEPVMSAAPAAREPVTLATSLAV